MMVTSKNFELIKFERERRCDLRDGLTSQRILLVTPGDDHDDDDDDEDDDNDDDDDDHDDGDHDHDWQKNLLWKSKKDATLDQADTSYPSK